MTLCQCKVGTFYYLKDLKCVCFACQGLPTGKDLTLFIDDELTKAFKILIAIIFSLGPLQDKIQWNKV